MMLALRDVQLVKLANISTSPPIPALGQPTPTLTLTPTQQQQLQQQAAEMPNSGMETLA